MQDLADAGPAQRHHRFAVARIQQSAREIQRCAAATDCNLDLPLWQLVRASTAAPTYFPPEVVTVGTQDFLFVDGGVTMYNNPAFQMFLMATLEPYRLQWKTGVDKMLDHLRRHRNESISRREPARPAT